MNEFLWGVVPYLSLAFLVGGTLHRYVSDPIGWGSRSSQLLERRWLKWGSLLFHWGILFVFVGHVLGLLVPVEVWRAIGVGEALYHLTADWVGGAAGAAAWAGLAVLLLRRALNRRVRLNSDVLMDWVALVLLFVVVSLGVAMTVGYNNVFGPYEYRTTVGPWIRSVLVLQPEPGLMARVPVLLQAHILAAWVLFAISPYTRLVHIWSLPLAYLRRAPIQYRSRTHYAHRATEEGGRT
ncbi:MAG: respiratory nitrate reductase subunit gamma [Actinomycetia bacterium]|nr:respiratory nitrate reductase subunit gamma [Actinomycetes bacterium]